MRRIIIFPSKRWILIIGADAEAETKSDRDRDVEDIYNDVWCINGRIRVFMASD